MKRRKKLPWPKLKAIENRFMDLRFSGKCNTAKNSSTKAMWIRFLEIDKEMKIYRK
jgi:hypothetical protein